MNIKRDFILFILFSGATFAKDYAMVKPLSQREIQDITVNFVQPLREDKELRQAVQKLYDRIRIDATQKDFNPGNYAASCLRVMLEWISQTNKHPEYRQIGVYRDAFTNRISEDKQKENITELITKLGDLQKNQTKVEECLDILRQIVNADEQVKLVELLGKGGSFYDKIKNIFDLYYEEFMKKGGDREYVCDPRPIYVDLKPLAAPVNQKVKKNVGNLLIANLFVMGLFTGVFDIWYRFTANPNYVRSSGYGPCVGYTPHMLMAGVLMLKTFCALVLN